MDEFHRGSLTHTRKAIETDLRYPGPSVSIWSLWGPLDVQIRQRPAPKSAAFMSSSWRCSSPKLQLPNRRHEKHTGTLLRPSEQSFHEIQFKVSSYSQCQILAFVNAIGALLRHDRLKLREARLQEQFITRPRLRSRWRSPKAFAPVLGNS